MPLSREELEAMEKTLKEAFQKAKEGFNVTKYGEVYNEYRRDYLTAIGATATALLQVDARLREMNDAPVAKLPAGPKLPGKE